MNNWIAPLKLAFLCIFLFCNIGLAQERSDYESQADFNFAKEYNLPPQGVKFFKSFGISNSSEYENAFKEMISSGYASKGADIKIFIQYIKDKAEGQKSSLSALDVKNKRTEIEQAKKLEASKEFPFIAYLTCERGGQQHPIEMCFLKQGVNPETELEVRNGDEYKLYKSIDLAIAVRKGQLKFDRASGLVISLRSSFEIKAQNAAEYYVLSLTVKDAATDKQLFKKSAAKWGVVQVSN